MLEDKLIVLKEKYSNLSGWKKIGIGILIGIITVVVAILLYLNRSGEKSTTQEMLKEYKEKTDKHTKEKLEKVKKIDKKIEKIKKDNKKIDKKTKEIIQEKENVTKRIEAAVANNDTDELDRIQQELCRKRMGID